ncbi:Thioredoxin [Cynara cardunculus var. scolymus]|uniref:Thioredoxin n=1 Tax=Cynara cardunculus var. scolymus TaxID=59895 RepID=A0A103XXZ7_CYNCS|nr:Thioredoxin [Cynara cardunculus var. scolymus]
MTWTGIFYLWVHSNLVKWIKLLSKEKETLKTPTNPFLSHSFPFQITTSIFLSHHSKKIHIFSGFSRILHFITSSRCFFVIWILYHLIWSFLWFFWGVESWLTSLYVQQHLSMAASSSSFNPISFPASFEEALTNSNGFLSPSIVSTDFLKKGSQIPSDHKGLTSSCWNAKTPVLTHASKSLSKPMRWWEKTLPPNMMEIKSAQELVDKLSNSGDRLVILDFYSPGCGGCKALHPKICQLAESNPNAIFLQVNYEALKPMCHSLRIHVLPFFRFYKGSEGKLCSFSCTIATIKKFKDALSKHGTDGGDVGAAKGLEESELLTLASIVKSHIICH